MNTFAQREARFHTKGLFGGFARYCLIRSTHDDSAPMAARLPIRILRIAWLKTPNRHFCRSKFSEFFKSNNKSGNDVAMDQDGSTFVMLNIQ